MLLRFFSLTTVITFFFVGTAVISIWLSDLPNHPAPHPIESENTQERGNAVFGFFAFAILYIYLSIAWIISYSVYFRFPEQFKLLLLGFLVCAPLQTAAFYSAASPGQSSITEGIIISGSISIVFTALQFAMFVYFFHRLKAEFRSFMKEYHAGQYPRLRAATRSIAKLIRTKKDR